MRTSRIRSLPLLIALGALLTAPLARAGDCPGAPGYELVMPSQVAIGQSFSVCMTAPGNSYVLVLISASSTPKTTKFGTLCVDLPFITIWGFQMPASGSICLDHPLECDPAVVGFTGHFQFAAIGPDPGVIGLSNGASLTAIDDGSCNCQVHPGDYVTYTQGGWGAKCNGGNPGCIRDANFPTVFPGGLIAGDQDGPDADAFHALWLTTSLAVQNFLPEGMTPATLNADVTDVTNCSAGVFAGQLVAAKINVAFDDAGVFDGQKNQTGGKLGDLVFVKSSDPKLLGYTVREMIELADKAISGELAAPIDVDNDGIGDITLSELSDNLDGVNNNFDEGTSDDGWLACP